MIGKTISHYRILRMLGEGGMGQVYEAEDTQLKRKVAIKILAPEVASDPQRLQRFEREARAVAALNHPNILGIHDFGSSAETYFAVMELLEGKTLREWLSDGPLPRRKAADLALQIARGLAAAHNKDIIHRDLKPENLFLTLDGQIKILDFGLAKFQEESPADFEAETAALSEVGQLLGTIAYMSPEQVRGESVDARSDIFSFGGVFYEMLTGQPAFRGGSAVETMNAILTSDPPEIEKGSLADDVDRMLRHCLEKNPLERYQSIRDLSFDLEALAVRSGEPRMALLAAGRRGRWRWAAITAALVIVSFFTGAIVDRAIVKPGPTPGQLTFAALTHSGRDRSPTASPDGRMVAFASDRDGTSRIWLKQLSGGGEAPLTEGRDDFPRFSPDGSHILFTRNEGGTSNLYRVPLVGGSSRKLVEDAAFGDWSPDGSRIAFVRWVVDGEQLDSVVAIASPTGAQSREVARFDGWALAHPRWAPDGRMIALTPVLDRQQPVLRPSIFLAAVDGSAPRVIRAPGSLRTISSVAWPLPDQLIYIQSASVVQQAGSSAQIIWQEAFDGRVLATRWSPSSGAVLDLLGPTGMVFDTRSPRENLREFSIEEGESDAARWLSRGSSTDRQPVYSPDGEWVAFSSNRGGNLDLWAVSTSTGELRRLTEHPADDWDPAFIDGGRRIMWSTNRTGHFECWVADFGGGNARQLTNDGVDAENPTAAQGGNWVVYVSTNPAQPGIWKIRLDATDATLLLAGRLNLPEVSPDGQYALYSLNLGPTLTAVRVLQVEDGVDVPFEILIERHPGATGSLGRARWMPDGQAIAFIGQDSKGLTGVFAQDFAPGRDTSASRRPVASFDPQVAAESFGISPDATRIVIAGWEQLFSISRADGLR